MCNTRQENILKIDVYTNDVVLTPLTCARLINEIIKCLVYQKSQIPYPYNWLRSSLSRKRPGNHIRNLKVQRHFQVASNAYEILEQIMRSISTEFEGCKDSDVGEVLIIFGSTPITPKEIYTLRIPKVATGHSEANHRGGNQHKILRDIFLSDEWLQSMENLPSTNMYVLLNKSLPLKSLDFFTEVADFGVPKNVKNTVISLNYDKKNDVCCDNMQIFNDESFSDFDCNSSDYEVKLKEGTWYQSKLLLKGFRDCFIDKVSVSELW